MWWLLLAPLTFQAPKYNAGYNGCEPDSIPSLCTDLDHFNVYGVRRGQTNSIFFQTLPGKGKQDQFITFLPTPPNNVDSIWSVYVTSVDSVGNESCEGRMWAINLPTSSVPYLPSVRVKDEWFDIVGRRLKTTPTTPGIYWKRNGKVVVPKVIL